MASNIPVVKAYIKSGSKRKNRQKGRQAIVRFLREGKDIVISKYKLLSDPWEID